MTQKKIYYIWNGRKKKKLCVRRRKEENPKQVPLNSRESGERAVDFVREVLKFSLCMFYVVTGVYDGGLLLGLKLNF
jgi:hypothetical protein